MIKGYINLSKLPKEYFWTNQDGEKCISIEIKQRKEISEKGYTHYAEVNTYNSQTKQSADQRYYVGNFKEVDFNKPSVTADTQSAYGISDDDLGF